MFEIIGWIGAVFGTCINIPQIVKTLRTKDVRGLSIWQFIMVMLTTLSFAIVSFEAKVYSMGVANSIGFFIALGEIILIIRLGKNDRN